MKLNLRDLESILISQTSAIVFALLGLGLGSVAYLKFKNVQEVTASVEVKDTRDPREVDREKRLNQATAMLEKNIFKASEELLLGLEKESPKNAFVLSSLAYAQKKLGKLENAEVTYKQAIEIEPGQWVLYHNLGVLLFDKGDPQEALKSFDKALELSPKNQQVLMSQAKVQEMVGKFTEARLSYGKALESGKVDGGTTVIIKDRLKKLDVLAYIERGDK